MPIWFGYGEWMPLFFKKQSEVKMKKIFAVLFLMSLGILNAQIKIKNIADFSGVESKQLIGYGLVVGLNGTGDGASSQITVQSIKNMMDRFGVTVPENKIKPNNVAAVIVTASLPPFSKVGSKIDVTVSSVGNARSLEGGLLLLTELHAAKGEIFASAQGPVSIGGFNTASKGNKIRKNYTLVGRIPNGAILTKSNSNNIIQNGDIVLNLREGDFSTAEKIAKKINKFLKINLATAQDSKSISIIVPDSVSSSNKIVRFVSNIENLEIIPEQKARVVINERTGTIVSGGNVTISEVAVSQGNLVIQIHNNSEELSLGGFTHKTTDTNIEAVADKARVLVMKAATVQDLARTLNSIKVTPRDLISIFQSLKVAGALQAELIIL